MAIDLTNPQGKYGGSFQAVTDLLATIGRIEQSRQDRQILDRFITAKAANPEASDISIIAGLTKAGPQFDTGLQGIFQRISSGLPEGQGTVLSQLQAGQVQTPQQAAQTEATKALTTQRATGKVTPPHKKTEFQTQRDSDMRFLDSGKGTEAQNVETRNRLMALPPGTLTEIEPSKLDEQFEKFMEVAKDKRIVRKKRILGFSDKVFGEEAFNAALEEAINEGLKDGLEPASMEAAFREWWDRQAEEQKGQKFQEFVPISEFGEKKQGTTATNPTTGEKIISFDGGKTWQPQ